MTIIVGLNRIVFGAFFVCLALCGLICVTLFAIIVFPVPHIEAYSNTTYAAGFQPANWGQISEGMPLDSAKALLGEPLDKQPAVSAGAPQLPGDEYWGYSSPKQDGGWSCYRLRVNTTHGTVTERSYSVERLD